MMVQGIDGLISGLPTSDLIDSMIEMSRGNARQLERQREGLQLRLDSLLTYNLRLLSAKLDLGSLKRQSSFQNTTLNSSNESAISGTVASGAEVGSTATLSVLQLAQAHQVSTTGAASDKTDLGSGTITLQVGNGQQETLTLDAASSSLSDVVAAINDADLGISASVINDGAASNPYRIVMQSEQTGLSNTITASGTGAFASLFDDATFTELTSAQDAQISLGTNGALTINSDTNTFEDVLPGTTLTVSEVASNVTVSIGNDTSAVKEDIETFVESLNSAISYLNANTQFNAETGEAGILIGESDLRLEMNTLISDLISPVDGLPTSRNTLTSVGITLTNDNTFEIDDAKLSAALSSDPEGVMKLFANSGDSSDSDISFLTMTNETDVSSDFTINVTQAASRAVTAGGVVASDSITITDGVNDSLRLNVNGTELNLTLADSATPYTRASLADHVETLLNDALPGEVEFNVEITDDNRFEFSSARYGSGQSISVYTGTNSTAASTLGISSTLNAVGMDVAGTINGQVASGSGQTLTGVDGTASQGLRLLVASDAPVSGVTFTGRKGIAQSVDERLVSFTDAVNGSITNKENSLTARLDDIDQRIEDIDERLEIRRATLFAEFRSMETILQQFNSQQTMLAGQLDAISNLNRSQSNRGAR